MSDFLSVVNRILMAGLLAFAVACGAVIGATVGLRVCSKQTIEMAE